MRPRNLRILLFSAVAVAAAAGCGGDENRPAQWSYISPAIIQPNCATSSCHSRGAAVAGLDLSSAEAGYGDLLRQRLPTLNRGTDMRQNVPRALVIPGNPSQSRMVNMLHAFGANRMPPDRPLASADIALIEEWVLEGATDE